MHTYEDGQVGFPHEGVRGEGEGRMDDLVDTTEMYLKAVLELEEAGIEPLRVRIAERLHHAKPTVSQTVARLERGAWLSLAPETHRLALSATGRRRAFGVLRKHRIAECFLDRVVGLDWAHVHEEACRWEHVMSDGVAERMAALLGHPERSPYGNPIPPVGATHWVAEVEPVRNLVRHVAADESPTEGRIAWIGEAAQSDPRALERLAEAGILPAASGTFQRHGPAVLSSTPRGEAELPHELAAQVFVAA